MKICKTLKNLFQPENSPRERVREVWRRLTLEEAIFIKNSGDARYLVSIAEDMCIDITPEQARDFLESLQ